ncbi:MAG: hypothetical protein V7647_4267 [Acidobacteriota bacterium]|jgi:hypothetical protein
MTRSTRLRTPLLTLAALLVFAPLRAGAQPFAGGAQMPDPKQMSGRPLPVADLAVGTVTVRVVRGSMANVISGQQVELSGGPSPLTAITNEQGRAEFPGLRPGTTVQATTTVDGERLESQQFTIPASGGIRVALVATDPAMEKRPAEDRQVAQAPAENGTVVLGEQSRFVVEMGEEALNVFYILEVVNTARVPVQPSAPLVFDLPSKAQGAGVLQGSAIPATVSGTRVTVPGPFPSGSALVQFGYSLPITAGTLTLEQKLPVALGQFSLMAQKVGDMEVQSPQIAEHRDMPVQGQIFIVGKGPAVPAGGTIALTFSGLPHQPVWPRNVALALAVTILLGGLWGSLRARGLTAGEVDRRRRLDAKRDRLFTELVAIEEQHRTGALAAERYATRRAELVAALENLYAEIDDEAAA